MYFVRELYSALMSSNGTTQAMSKLDSDEMLPEQKKPANKLLKNIG